MTELSDNNENVLEMQYGLLLGVKPFLDLSQSILHFAKHCSEKLGLKSAHIYKLDIKSNENKSIKILKHTRISSRDHIKNPEAPLLQAMITRSVAETKQLIHFESGFFGFISHDCRQLVLFEKPDSFTQQQLVDIFEPAISQLNEYCYVFSKKQTETEAETTYIDRLTRLPDRREFKYSLLKLLSNAIRQKYFSALVYLNIDNFKFINNSLGHSTGDLIITKVAERLKKFCRSGDYIFRMGGDEFVFVLNHLGERTDTATISAQNIAIRIMENIVKPFELGGQKVYLTTSIGISMFPSENELENDSENRPTWPCTTPKTREKTV